MIFALGGSMPAGGGESLEFNRDVRPILSDKCFACHGPDGGSRQADLRLDVRDDAIADRGGYAVIVPGKPDESELVVRIAAEDDDERMPPSDHGKRLSDQEIDILKQWIAQGAAWQEHWSLMPLQRPELPPVSNAPWVRSPVDRCVLARLERVGIAPSPPADPRTLIRRLSIDLTGLPPTPEQVADFANNPSGEAYDAAVDRLLSSPHYGERMAMYWLDLVRYADTLGYHGDQDRSVSPYRDYVIAAFNENKPFDQFTIENLAGDLLPGATLTQKVASTYNRLNRASAEGGVQPKEYLAKYSADRVRTTGSVWLGSTFGCAECHDHKFDPFTTKDFYQFAAFFADIKEQGIVADAKYIEQLPVPTARQQQQREQLDAALSDATRALQQQTPEIVAQFEQWQEQMRQAPGRWEVLKPATAESASGATLQIQDDGSILATGTSPDKDVYTVAASTTLSRLANIRLELLDDASLPAKGPGRASNGNLVIQSLQLSVDGQNVPWKSATATHSQAGFPIDNLVNGKAAGWAILPQVGQPLQAVFVAQQAVDVKATEDPAAAPTPRLTFVITQNHGDHHTVGRFRLYASVGVDPVTVADIVPPDVVNILDTAAAQRSAEQTDRLWGYFRENSTAMQPLRTRLAELQSQKAALEQSIVTTLATSAGEPREIRVLPRGNWMDDSGEVVQPHVPHFLPQPDITGRRLNRLDLAQWLVASDNPLPARTFVNRIWMLFFGQGISRSVDDLGSQGQWPTHPDLLDWLAVELIDSGWDIKHVVRLIVTSNTYRQSSDLRPELRQRDPSNRLLARQSRWRIEAELVRDNALSVSGLLADKIGGPSVKPYQPAGYWDQLNFPKRTYEADTGESQYRRGLYTHWQRTFLHPSLLAFDAPVREECTARRERSNTPLQALVLLNDPTYVEAARVFAARMVRDGGDDAAAKIRWAYGQVLARQPTETEQQVLTEFLQRNRTIYQQDPESAAKLVRIGMAPVAEDLDPVDLAAWTCVARAMFNLHETITRY